MWKQPKERKIAEYWLDKISCLLCAMQGFIIYNYLVAQNHEFQIIYT